MIEAESFNKMKEFNGIPYTGMRVGGTHHWNYPDGKWVETKVSPDRWDFEFTCTKSRKRRAPVNSGAMVGTEYNWYIIADQRAMKLSTDEYQTVMKGSKWKIGHKRPNWRSFSYEYPNQQSYRQKVIEILRDTLEQMEREEEQESLLQFVR